MIGAIEKLLKIIFFGGMFGMGAWSALLSLQGLLQAQAATDWPYVMGTVERVYTHGGNNKGSTFITKYRYSVYGNSYQSDRTNFGMRENCHRCSADYREGQSVKVYYDPTDPSSAVLKQDDYQSIWRGLIGGLLFMFATYGIYWLMNRKRRAANAT